MYVLKGLTRDCTDHTTELVGLADRMKSRKQLYKLRCLREQTRVLHNVRL